MKIVESIPNIEFHENPHQNKRIKEIMDFWGTGAEFAELTVFNPNTKTQTEVKHYEKAARQARLGYSKINILQRKGRVYAQRLDMTALQEEGRNGEDNAR